MSVFSQTKPASADVLGRNGHDESTWKKFKGMELIAETNSKQLAYHHWKCLFHVHTSHLCWPRPHRYNKNHPGWLAVIFSQVFGHTNGPK